MVYCILSSSSLSDRGLRPAFWGACTVFQMHCSHLPKQTAEKEQILQRRNKHIHPFFSLGAFPRFFSFFFLRLLALAVSQPSICHPQPVSAPSKGSDFKMEHFSSASLGAQLRCLSLYRGRKKKRPTSLHQRREIRGWKEMHKPTYTQKCGSSIYCPHLYLAWYSEPYRWFCNDKVIMAIPAICLSDFQLFSTVPSTVPLPPLNNRNSCYNLGSLLRNIRRYMLRPLFIYDRHSRSTAPAAVPRDWAMLLSPHPGNLIWMDILAQLSGPVSICEHPHQLIATIVQMSILPVHLSKASPIQQSICHIGNVCSVTPSAGEQKICFWLGLPIS